MRTASLVNPTWRLFLIVTRPSRYGLNIIDVHDAIQTAIGGRMVTTTVEGRERYMVQVRYMRRES